MCSGIIRYYRLWRKASERVESTTFLFGDGILSKWPYCQSDLKSLDYSLIIKTTSSVHFTTVHANLIEQTINRTRRFETLHNCCHQERFQMFITTLNGATSTNFVVKTDLQNFGWTCGSLRKSFWRRDVKNTHFHLKLGFRHNQDQKKERSWIQKRLAAPRIWADLSWVTCWATGGVPSTVTLAVLDKLLWTLRFESSRKQPQQIWKSPESSNIQQK